MRLSTMDRTYGHTCTAYDSRMPTTSGRRRRPSLTREAVVAHAIAVADTEGADAVTIRRLATDHDVTPMALYWHFKDKDQLFDAIAESVCRSVSIPADTSARWGARLHGILQAFLEVLRSHPGVAGLVSTRMLLSEAGLDIAEHVLGLLREGGFPPEEAAEISSYLLASIITLVTAEPGSHAGLDGDEAAAAVRTRRAALSALDPQRFPNVIASAGALAMCSSRDEWFSRGVEILVAGTQELRPRK